MTRGSPPAAPPPPRGAEGAGPPAERPVDRTASPPPTITSQALFDGASELRIDHDGTLYRLKRTALGKLILTK